MARVLIEDLEGYTLSWIVGRIVNPKAVIDLTKLRTHLESLDEDELWDTLCENTPGDIDASIMSESEMIDYGVSHWRVPHYSTDRELGGAILESEKIGTAYDSLKKRWNGWKNGYGTPSFGPTPLVAGLRCFVASKCEQTFVEVPDELLGVPVGIERPRGG